MTAAEHAIGTVDVLQLGARQAIFANHVDELLGDAGEGLRDVLRVLNRPAERDRAPHRLGTLQPEPAWFQDDVLEGEEASGVTRAMAEDQDPAEYDELNLTNTTRRIVRTQRIPDPPGNLHDKSAPIRATLMAQRRSPSAARRGEDWEDAESFSLARLPVGQEVRIEFGANQTKRLFLALARRYAEAETLEEVLADLSLTVGRSDDVYIAKGKEKEAIETLLEQEGQDIWEHLGNLAPGIVKTVGLRKQHEDRVATLALFESHMNADDWREQNWQEFFQENTWIFGFGLAYQFMTIIDGQPHYGGTRLDGTGSQRGDYLARTEADARFTVLVEIKKPSSELMHSAQYRPGGGVFRPASELIGGVAQLQANCETWIVDGAQARENVIELDSARTYTHEPRGILIIGHTEQLSAHRGKAASFERFRRLMHNPEVITFDELYNRAAYLVEVDHERLEDTEERSNPGD